MSAKEILFYLFFAMASVLIAQPISKAYAGDFFEDVFSSDQPEQKPPFDQAADDCVKKVPVRDTYEKHVVFTHCFMSHKLSSSYTEIDNAYLIRMLETEKNVLAGEDYTEAKLKEKTWRQAQLNNFHQRLASAQEQRRLANAVENIPLQQAWWAVTIQGINQASRGYTPRMYVNKFQ